MFDVTYAVRKLVTTPDDLGPCQEYCEGLKAEVRRLRKGIQSALDSRGMMGAEDIDTLVATLSPVDASIGSVAWPSQPTCTLCGDDGPLSLRGRCHPTAPLRVVVEDETLTLRCYVPDCDRVVAQLRIVDAAEVSR